MDILKGINNRSTVKRDSILKNVDMGRVLMVAGCIVTMLSSIVASEQQKQQNREIAREVVALMREESKKAEVC